MIAEALDSGFSPAAVLTTPAFEASAQGVALRQRLGRPAVLVEESLLSELADSDSPRGALAVITLRRCGIEQVPVHGNATFVFLDRIQDPGNLGAIARVAEAFGVHAMILAPGCVHPNHPRALRGSAGSLLRVPVTRGVTVGALNERLASVDPLWAGLVAHAGDPIPEQRPAGALVLVLGSEAHGLSKESEAMVSRRWRLPLSGRVESLNVAVAAGIALFALRHRG